MGLLNKDNKGKTTSIINVDTLSIDEMDILFANHISFGHSTSILPEDSLCIISGYGPNKIIKTWFSMGKKCGAYWEYTYYVLREDGTFKYSHKCPLLYYGGIWAIGISKECFEKWLDIYGTTE